MSHAQVTHVGAELVVVEFGRGVADVVKLHARRDEDGRVAWASLRRFGEEVLARAGGVVAVRSSTKGSGLPGAHRPRKT